MKNLPLFLLIGTPSIMLCLSSPVQSAETSTAEPLASKTVAPPVFISPAAKTSWKFSFGDKALPGTLLAASATTYTSELGYGFEAGSEVIANLGFITSTKPFVFSAAVPQGNYRVTVTLGDKDGESNTTVKAEARRLMVENVSTSKAQIATRSFIVNVRTPKFMAGSGEVRINAREIGLPLHLNWDEKLTLEFNGTRPCVRSLEITQVEDLPMIYLVGDSTVTDQLNEPYAAWGQMLPRFFKPTIAVANHAESGLALSSFRYQKRLDKVMAEMKAGDFVFVQFGHNDQKDKAVGAGAFTTYKAHLKDYVARVRERGGNVILVSPMERRRWKGGQPQPTLADYAEAVRQVGTEENVLVIDLNALSLKLYGALGEAKSKRAFAYATVEEHPTLKAPVADNTHFSNYGAYELARGIVQEIKTQVPKLAPYLADEVSPFDSATPDALDKFAVPESTYRISEKPAGS